MEYSIVVPVYNSSRTLPVLLEEIREVMARVGATYEVVFVDDCSPDESWSVLRSLQQNDPHVRILRLANNVGQWMATIAGIRRSKGRHILTIDDDLEYETADIRTLIDTYHRSGAYIVYGIPSEKKNKNLSYRLFFRLRDRFLRLFFDKIQTESFKIFRREIYFDQDGQMYSHLHFEAYTKFTVASRFVGYADVGYRKRYFGNSNHTLYMKFRIMVKYGIEYYRSPFKYPIYLLLALSALVLAGPAVGMPEPVLILLRFSMAFLCLLVVGILGKYLSTLFLKTKGLPEYVIIEEFGLAAAPDQGF